MNSNRRNILEYLLTHNYNPRPHLTKQILEMYQADEKIFVKNPLKFIKFLTHNYGPSTGMQLAEMFYDRLEEVEQIQPPSSPSPLPFPDEQVEHYMRSKYMEMMGIHICPYCYQVFQNAGDLQNHRDVKHSNSKEEGVMFIPERHPFAKEEQKHLMKRADKNSVTPEAYEPEDPGGKAQQVLDEDSKRWAAEYIPAPPDTPLDKAEELRERAEKMKKGQLRSKEMDVLDALRNQQAYSRDFSLPPTISSINASLGYGEDYIRRALEWLRYKNLITKEEHERLTHPDTEKQLREEWAKNKPPEIPMEKLKGWGPTTQEVVKKVRQGYTMENYKWKKKRGRPSKKQ